MLRRNGSGWQITLAVAGLTILALAVLAGRLHQNATLVADPAAQVAAAVPPAAVQAAPVAGQQAAPAAPAAPAAAAPAGSDSPRDAAPPRVAASGSAKGHARVAPGSVPVVPAVVATGQTLFADSFATAPLGTGLPAGWVLGDQAQSSSGGLPIIGGLLGGLPVVGSTINSLMPQTVLDGSQRVLARATGAWSHLSAGSTWVDYAASADVKPTSSGLGFVGVAGRYQNANNYVTCGVKDDQTLELVQVIGGKGRLLDSQPATIASGVFHTVRMNLQGGQLTCALDGVTLLHGTDTSVTSGHIGLIALGDVTSEFDNVVATALP